MACNSIIGYRPSVPQTIAESTHVAAVIYYRKTLFGSRPKLTAVQCDGGLLLSLR
jgi:hypothetical protein